MAIKITATMLFVLIVVILTLSVVFSRIFAPVEGFITFNSKTVYPNDVQIKQ